MPPVSRLSWLGLALLAAWPAAAPAATPEEREPLGPAQPVSGALELLQRRRDAGEDRRNAFRVQLEAFDVMLPASLTVALDTGHVVGASVVVHRNINLLRRRPAFRRWIFRGLAYDRDTLRGLDHALDLAQVLAPVPLLRAGGRSAAFTLVASASAAGGWRWLSRGRQGLAGELGAGLAASLRLADRVAVTAVGRGSLTAMTGGGGAFPTASAGVWVAAALAPPDGLRAVFGATLHHDGALDPDRAPRGSAFGHVGLEWGSTEAPLDHALGLRWR